MIYGKVKNSVIFPGVYVGEGSVIEDSIIMSYSRIGKNSCICQSITGEKVIIGDNVKIGFGECIVNELKPAIYDSGITVIGDEAFVPSNTEIGKNVVIDADVTLEDFCCLSVPSGKSIYKGGVCE